MGFFFLVAIAFAIYSFSITANYKQLRINEIRQTVAYESERVEKIIAEMERNAVDLALAGEQFYNAGNYADSIGALILVENFTAFRTSVGGGIWFEPYILNPKKQRVCFYAFFDPAINAVRIASEFENESYDYHTQIWYTQIASRLKGKYSTAWTKPYFEEIGTVSLMTTVGAGIYDKSGKLIGMSTVDWQIQSMVDRLSAIKPTENSFFTLYFPQDDHVISNAMQENSGADYMVFSHVMSNDWIFSVQIPAKEIFEEIEKRNKIFSVFVIISAIFMLGSVFYLLSKLVNQPLKKLTLGVAELGSGNFDKQIEIFSKNEIGMLAAAFNKMTVDLKTSIEQSARERTEKERINAELNVATQIQSGMLPCIFPAFPNRSEFDIYASMLSAKEVGGDFYDFFFIDEKTLCVVIADVSGKGIPAALFMVIAKTLIKNNAQLGKSPKEVFEIVNDLLCENNEAGMFVTAFMGYLDIPSGKFTFVNAGHNPPILRSNNHWSYLKANRSFVLAGMEGVFYKQSEIILLKGDELFLYTDGVTEAMNSVNALFGEARLLEVVKKHSNLPLREFTVSIKHEIDKFANGVLQADDIAMLALRLPH
ncbi:MAG: SpoIIE family protein phosphatase [Fibromonadaceae bacterium]|nr:SpoIIE family protein phosphatase [Fibromonadaceae bacterium]